MATYTTAQLIAIAEFLGDDITDEQSSKLMAEIKQQSIADQESILNSYGVANCPALYTEMSMYDGEMGGLSRY